jgi:hypothetical protein
MLPLAITFLATIYLYAPALVFRWAVGLAVGRENLKQPPSKIEETTQALVWIAIPLTFTLLWVAVSRAVEGYGLFGSVETVAGALYSEPSFRASPQVFYANFWAFTLANLHVLWRLYLIVVVYSGITYTVLRRSRGLYQSVWGRRLVRFALVTSPPLAEWFTLLSGMFVPKNLEIHADVLTKNGALYQGRVSDYSLDPGGTLRTLTLDRPRRFLHDEYRVKRTAWPATKPEIFWKDIPGNLFVVTGSEIANINFRYVRRQEVISASLSGLNAGLLEQLISKSRAS